MTCPQTAIDELRVTSRTHPHPNIRAQAAQAADAMESILEALRDARRIMYDEHVLAKRIDALIGTQP